MQELTCRIKYIDSVETETHVYIATERVRPLEGVLREWQTGGPYASSKGKGKEHWIGWGIQSVAVRADSPWRGVVVVIGRYTLSDLDVS